MKKSVSLSRICLVVCIIILLATAIVTSPFGSLLPVFGFVALLDLIPLVRGNRAQKIAALVILAIAVTLFIFAIEGFKLQQQRLERMRKTHVPQQISPTAQFDAGFYHISAWRFERLMRSPLRVTLAIVQKGNYASYTISSGFRLRA